MNRRSLIAAFAALPFGVVSSAFGREGDAGVSSGRVSPAGHPQYGLRCHIPGYRPDATVFYDMRTGQITLSA